MDPTKFQKEVIARLQTIESKVFGGTKEEKYGSAREEAEAISDGKSENHFNGERTFESAKQRVTAFYERYDGDSIQTLHGDELTQFHKESAIVEMLIKKYNLQNLARELRS